MREFKKYFLIISATLVVVTILYALSLGGNVSGRIVLNLNSEYTEGQPLEGVLSLSLREGELIPADSKLVIETKSEKSEYFLRDILNQNPSRGSFYVENSPLSGNGEGYGFEGEKEVYPEVSFKLNILSEKGPESSKTEQQTNRENSSKKSAARNNERPSQNRTQKISNGRNENINTTASENAGSNLIKGIANLFFTLTGQATLEIKDTVSGRVSADKEFTYSLNPSETAELVSGSVKSNSAPLSDSTVDVEVNNNEVIVTTDYSESENGFGNDYLTENKKSLDINLSKLDLNLNKSGINISVEYQGTEITSLYSEPENGELSATSSNETISGLNISLPKNNVSLTDSDKKILKDKFGNTTVKTTKAELVNDRIVLRYELENYWVEFSYDKELTENELASQTERDRINWLKNIARKLSDENENREKIDSLIKNYDI